MAAQRTSQILYLAIDAKLILRFVSFRHHKVTYTVSSAAERNPLDPSPCLMQLTGQKAGLLLSERAVHFQHQPRCVGRALQHVRRFRRHGVTAILWTVRQGLGEKFTIERLVQQNILACSAVPDKAGAAYFNEESRCVCALS